MISREDALPVPTLPAPTEDATKRSAGFGLLERMARFQRVFLAATNPPAEMRSIINASVAALERRADKHRHDMGMSVDALLEVGASDLARYIANGDGLGEPLNEADVAIAWASHEALLAAASTQPGGALAVKFYRQTPAAVSAKERAEQVQPSARKLPDFAPPQPIQRKPGTVGAPASSMPVAPDIAPKPVEVPQAKTVDVEEPLDTAPFKAEPAQPRMENGSFLFGAAETPRPPPPLATAEPGANPPEPTGSDPAPVGKDQG